MRTFIAALLVLVSLLSGIFIYSGYIKNTEKNLSEIISELSENVTKGQWDESKNGFKKLKSIWGKNEKILAMFNDHEDLDEIRLSIGELGESISYENAEHSKKSIEDIRILLERLVKNESFSFENILGLAHKKVSCHIML